MFVWPLLAVGPYFSLSLTFSFLFVDFRSFKNSFFCWRVVGWLIAVAFLLVFRLFSAFFGVPFCQQSASFPHGLGAYSTCSGPSSTISGDHYPLQCIVLGFDWAFIFFGLSLPFDLVPPFFTSGLDQCPPWWPWNSWHLLQDPFLDSFLFPSQ